MTCIGSQLIFCSPQQILRRTAVEKDENNFITGFYGLENRFVETAHTLFFDGIISADIISLKQNITIEKIKELTANYNFVDLSEGFSTVEIIENNKPLICDFGTNSLSEINLKLAKTNLNNSSFSIFDIIASCVYYPALLLDQKAELSLNSQTKLLLWENVDLVNKTITANTKIRGI